jgi:4-hydroxybenzoate polyprenyltransferase
MSGGDTPLAAPPPLHRRLLRYQAERFPLAAYGPMVGMAAFAAVSWSRAARGAGGSLPAGRLAAGAFTMLVLFFLLRVADEHKDASADLSARPELPVPRGLVSLAELRVVGLGLLAVAAGLNAVLAPRLLWMLLAVLLWAGLMTREFFAPAWMRARPWAYLLSHMMIMPLILLYGTAVDWFAAGAGPPPALWVFLGAAFASGLVLEIGRKLRDPGAERAGVETYSASWGRGRAVAVWGAALAAAALAVGTGMLVAGAPAALAVGLPVAAGALVAMSAAGVLHARPGSGRRIEAASGAWSLAAYLFLALPWLLRAVQP